MVSTIDEKFDIETWSRAWFWCFRNMNKGLFLTHGQSYNQQPMKTLILTLKHKLDFGTYYRQFIDIKLDFDAQSRAWIRYLNDLDLNTWSKVLFNSWIKSWVWNFDAKQKLGLILNICYRVSTNDRRHIFNIWSIQIVTNEKSFNLRFDSLSHTWFRHLINTFVSISDFLFDFDT